jgi:hypothetical protein
MHGAGSCGRIVSMLRQTLFAWLGTILLLACGGSAGEPPADAGSQRDAAAGDAATPDAGANPADSGASEDGGHPADGGADPDDGGAQCSACIAQTLRWERDGGFVAYRSANEIEPCRDYEHTRTPFGSGGTTASCTGTVPCEGDAVTLDDLNTALAHTDDGAGVAAAPILYGYDSRPVDGQILQITRGGRTVSVGSPCEGGSGECVEIPPGVEALRALLTSLEGERLAEEDCASMFP